MIGPKVGHCAHCKVKLKVGEWMVSSRCDNILCGKLDYRGIRESRRCPMCGGEHFRSSYQSWGRISAVCGDCGTEFLAPVLALDPRAPCPYHFVAAHLVA